jgi:hypothetical protein
MPCCWATTLTASARSSRSRPAIDSASRQRLGWHSVPPGCGAVAVPTTTPSAARMRTTWVDWGRSGPRDQFHDGDGRKQGLEQSSIQWLYSRTAKSVQRRALRHEYPVPAQLPSE